MNTVEQAKRRLQTIHTIAGISFFVYWFIIMIGVVDILNQPNLVKVAVWVYLAIGVLVVMNSVNFSINHCKDNYILLLCNYLARPVTFVISMSTVVILWAPVVAAIISFQIIRSIYACIKHK